MSKTSEKSQDPQADDVALPPDDAKAEKKPHAKPAETSPPQRTAPDSALL